MALILVIDDDAALRRMIRLALEAADHEVLEAEDGARGMALLGSRAPDLLVTDILMPTKEGIETIREVRALKPELPIVAISGGGRFDGPELLGMARTFGADVALAKPFRPVQLIQAVDRLLASPPKGTAET